MSPADVTILEAKLADAEETCDRLADEVIALAADKASLLELLNQACARADREQALREELREALVDSVETLREVHVSRADDLEEIGRSVDNARAALAKADES